MNQPKMTFAAWGLTCRLRTMGLKRADVLAPERRVLDHQASKHLQQGGDNCGRFSIEHYPRVPSRFQRRCLSISYLTTFASECRMLQSFV